MVHLTLLVSSFFGFLKHKKKPLIWVSFAILLVFSAFRYGYGNDFYPYRNIFTEIKVTGWHSELSDNVLFILLNKICPTYQFFLALTSLLFLATMFLLIYRNVSEKYQGLALLVFLINPYLFLMSLSIIRQCLALLLFVLAINFSMKRKIIPYIAIILLASLVHTSAILLLPFYFLANDRKPSRIFLIVTIGVLLLLIFNPLSFDWVMGFFEEFMAESRYTAYTESGSNTLRATLLSSSYLIYVVLNIRKLEGRTLAYAKLYMMAPILAILAYKIAMFTRLQMYFDYFSIIALPGIIEANQKKEKDFVLRLINIYAFPILIFTIYALRYYSFFTNDLWETFRTYRINLELF